MKRSLKTLMATILVLSISAVTFGGTITGSRTSRTGTITGSRTGTITGSRTGTITGSRTQGSSTSNYLPVQERNTVNEDWFAVLVFLLNAYF